MILAFALIHVNPAFAISEWDKTAPAGTSLAADIDANVATANNEALDRLLIGYRKGLGINYNSASTISVLTGEIAIPNSDGSVVRYRRLTTAGSVSFSDIDTGAETSSTTYYVWILGDTAATTPTFCLSTNSSAPSGKTYYTKIGQLYNDASSNITNVISYRNDYGTDYPDVIEGWVNFNASGTLTINDQYNVSSITDDGTGIYTINWATAFANSYYAIAGVAGGIGDSGNFPGRICLRNTASPLTTTSAKIEARNHGETLDDFTYNTVIASGDRT